MATSYRQFINEVYEEHVEEASFLYEQRLSFLMDQELEWFSYYSEERRFEAHLDGLIIGNEKALLICKGIALEGDVGAIYTLVTLYCQLNQRDELLSNVNEFDLTDYDVQQAIQLALLHRMPEDWVDSFLHNLISEQLILLSLFLPVLIKINKIPNDIAFEHIFDGSLSNEQIDPIPFIQAAGYLRENPARKQLENLIVYGTDAEKNAAVISLFRLGKTDVVEHTMANLEHQSMPLLSIASGASKVFFTDLIENNDHTSWTVKHIESLAIGGVAEFIPELIKLLKQEHLAEFAAKSLFIITGARLIDNIFNEETWDKEDLFEDELEAFNQGIMPQRTDGRPFGEEGEKISSTFEVWLNWWQQNHGQYVSGKRYRFGLMISPVSLVRTLNTAFADHVIRELSFQELSIRYNAKRFFSTKDYIQVQQKSILALYHWAQKVEGNYIPGEWYFSGNKQ